MSKRKDATLIKNNSMAILMPYILPKRADSEIYINYKLDVTNLIKYVDKKKKENPEIKLTYFHTFVTAIGKILYNRPKLNYFIVNKKYYKRNNVSISFVAKTEFNDKSEEFMAAINIDENDNLNDIREKITNKVTKIRSNNPSSIDTIIKIIGKLPGIIKSIIMKLVIFLDKHDLLPKSIKQDNIYYSTVLVSNIGSLNCGAIYHHLTEFGTNSIIITIGNIHKEKIINNEGKEEIKDICEFGICLDERIADGFYFIKSIKLLEDIFNNPILLEDKVNTELKKDD